MRPLEVRLLRLERETRSTGLSPADLAFWSSAGFEAKALARVSVAVFAGQVRQVLACVAAGARPGPKAQGAGL